MDVFLCSDVSGFKLSCRHIAMGTAWASRATILHDFTGCHLHRMYHVQYSLELYNVQP